MSAEHGSAPDLDLLADFAAGVLDGTPAGDRVAALVATDPRWAELYAALAPAQAQVAADLTAWTAPPLPGAAVPPVPADVAARLDRALHEAGDGGRWAAPGDASGGAPAEQAGGTVRGPGATATVTSLTARRRRRLGWALGGAVAASVAVLAVGGIGVTVLQQGGPETTSAAAGSGAADREDSLSDSGPAVVPSAPPGPAPRDGQPGAGARAPVRLLASGNDYDQARIGAAGGPLARLVATASAGATPARVPEGLAPLTAPAALSRCLQALAGGASGTAAGAGGRVTLVDYARFEGRPALVVVRQTAGGALQVVVAGPGCGRTGPDELFRTVLAR